MAKRVVPEEKRRRRRPTRSGQVLSEALIVDAALRLLREHGSSGLTARRLGLALDCDPSTLYRYFRGMDDLTLALGDALMGRALRGWRPTGEWRADLRAVGLRIHEAYVSHPQAAVLTASRVSGRANELAADEAVLDVLRSAGFPPAETVRIYHAFIDTTLGFAALDAASLALPGPARRADEEMWHSTYARLPASTHPRIAEVAPLLAARMVTSAYPTALDMLLDSAAARLGRPGGPGGTRAADRPVSGPGRTADAVRGGAPGPPSR